MIIKVVKDKYGYSFKHDCYLYVVKADGEVVEPNVWYTSETIPRFELYDWKYVKKYARSLKEGFRDLSIEEFEELIAPYVVRATLINEMNYDYEFADDDFENEYYFKRIKSKYEIVRQKELVKIGEPEVVIVEKIDIDDPYIIPFRRLGGGLDDNRMRYDRLKFISDYFKQYVESKGIDAEAKTRVHDYRRSITLEIKIDGKTKYKEIPNVGKYVEDDLEVVQKMKEKDKQIIEEFVDVFIASIRKMPDMHEVLSLLDELKRRVSSLDVKVKSVSDRSYLLKLIDEKIKEFSERAKNELGR